MVRVDFSFVYDDQSLDVEVKFNDVRLKRSLIVSQNQH